MEDKPRILVVEDDISWQDIYREALTRSGYLVQTASNLTEALEALDRCFFHVAVVDLKLSADENNRDGMKVLRRIWALDEGTLAIVGSGYVSVSMYDEFQRMGIFGYTEIPADARKALQSIEFYRGQIRKDEPLGNILDKVDKAVHEAQPKSIWRRLSVSPFGILRSLSAREVQQMLHVGPMLELRPFLSTLVRPLFPWLQAKNEVIPIRDDQQIKYPEILALETLCWSRALGKAVTIRFGRLDSFQKALNLMPIGSRFEGAKIDEELSHKASTHFEGMVCSLLSMDFNQYFDAPPIKNG
ncbi:MAG: response regulator [Chloroflexi bacterium]|nr:response regulator [Chloroflexota bacterium]